MFVSTNPNPCRTLVGDCVIRAVSIAEGKKWAEVYIDICAVGLQMCDMPSSNSVWRQYLLNKGYVEHLIDGDIRVREFADNNKKGVYILGTGSHVVAVVDGNYCDTWDSGDEPVVVYYKKGEVKNGNATV